MSRALAAYVHVVGEDGQPVVLAPGTEVPAWAKDQVTNPLCYADGASPEAVAEAQAATKEPETVKADMADGKGDADAGYSARKAADLKQIAGERGLSAEGTKDELVARLEADDREKADAAPAAAQQ